MKTKSTFGKFIRDQIKTSGKNQAELARISEISDAQISRVKWGANAGIVFCIKIAKGLEINPLTVLYEAGWLPFGINGDDVLLEEWKHILFQLPQSERDELMQIARLKLGRQESKQNKVKPYGLPEV
jgi:hypothetical protein